MTVRIRETMQVRAGWIVRNGRGWARQQRLLNKLAKPKGPRK
jgi:hypothetical protein